MTEAVLLVGDGHSYQKAEIENWLKTHNTSPITNTQLNTKLFVCNRALQSQIDEYIKGIKLMQQGDGFLSHNNGYHINNNDINKQYMSARKYNDGDEILLYSESTKKWVSTQIRHIKNDVYKDFFGVQIEYTTLQKQPPFPTDDGKYVLDHSKFRKGDLRIWSKYKNDRKWLNGQIIYRHPRAGYVRMAIKSNNGSLA
eukprot:373900_1